MKPGGVKYRNAEKLSRLVLYILAVVAVLVFCAFYFIGYDNQYEENPVFNAPMLTGVLVGFLIMLVVIALAVSVLAVMIGLKERDRGDAVVNGIHVARNCYLVAAFTLMVMLLAFMSGSSSGIIVNGKVFTNVMWLKVADMFVISSLVMILAALGAIAFGYARCHGEGNDSGRTLKS